MKNLPIGISTFEKIINDNYLYVDKTSYILNLIESGYQYTFLSRPRRFGKSLFLSTLKATFQGEKELFKGLYIYDKYDFDPHPVIYINFTDGDFSKPNGLQNRILEILDFATKDLNITINHSDDTRYWFSSLIKETYNKTGKKVVVLIDEYDKPILDAINNSEIAQQNKEYLKVFYSVLKANDEYIRFCFMTGVSKFSKVSIFSGLNNLKDITLSPKFASICGYTHSELDDYFADYLCDVDKQKLAYWYDGYNFTGEKVYNPYDILLFFSEGNIYKNYWFETGTPTFLMNLIKQQQYFVPQLDKLKADESLLNSFDIENLNIETLLFQSGYLTIKKIIENYKGYTYELDFPNFEVRNSFNEYVFSAISNLKNIDYQINTRQALLECDMPTLKENLHLLFASIPYRQGKIHTYEGYYANIIFAHFKTLGLDVTCEERTNKGRIDLLVCTPDYICLVEFKVGTENALEQIKSKGYHEKYANEKVILLGINFDEDERNISKFEWEEVS